MAQLSRPLLPLLRDLHIILPEFPHEEADAVESRQPQALLFVGPALRTFRFAPRLKKVTAAFCTQLPKLSPFLEELELSIDTAIEPSALAVAEMLTHLPALRVLDIQVLASSHDIDAILSALAVHRRLEKLQIRSMDLTSSHFVPARHGGFASLRQVTSVSCPGISLFLNSLSPTSECTYIQVTDAYMSPNTVAEFFHLAGTFKGLKSLILESYGDDSEVPSIETLGPLRLCSMLETLSIVLLPRINIHDNDLEMLLSHLPRLIDFTFGCAWQRGSAKRPNLTLRALAIVATSCPMIQSISINLDASKNADHPMVYRPTRLGRIDVQGSYIEDIEAVVRFLARLPASGSLKLQYSDMMNNYREQWKAVGACLSFFQVARDRRGLSGR
ncbi:hypothetical protein FRB93_012668 [Tulasnella sp. JGI-2019a]|nr:hypothetical protein FRB93_012668 [Tulasnella sp. JGI-2019a]